MGRKRRELTGYLLEWSDLEAVGDLLSCKYCKLILPFKQNRIQEHVGSQKHAIMKKNIKNTIPIKDILHRDRSSSCEIEMDLVKIVLFDGLPFQAINKESSLRNFLNKYSPASRSLPDGRVLIDKHISSLFLSSMDAIKLAMVDVRFCLIVDEPPDFNNRPIFNTLACYYDLKSNKRMIFMLDSSRILNCNAVIVANQVANVLKRYNLVWDNCCAIISDSASYMKKFIKDLKAMYPHIIRIPCFSHIIHLAVRKAVDEYFFDIKKFSMKFASILSKNRNAKNIFMIHLKKNNFENFKEIPRVMDIRWYSFYNCLKQIKEYYPAVVDFLNEVTHLDFGKRLNEILPINSKNTNVLFLSVTMLIDELTPLVEFSKRIETNENFCFSSIFDWMNNDFGMKNSLSDHKDNLGLLPFEIRTNLIKKIESFRNAIIDKIQEFLSNSINDCFPSANFFKTIKNIDPDMPLSIENIHIDDLCYLIGVKDKVNLKDEYDFLCRALKDSNHPSITTDFWKEKSNICPLLSRLSLDLLALPISSIAVERSFSKLNHVIRKERMKLSDERASMVSILYFNGPSLF